MSSLTVFAILLNSAATIINTVQYMDSGSEVNLALACICGTFVVVLTILGN